MESAIKYLIFIVSIFTMSINDISCQTTHDLLKAADANYKAEDYPQAEIYYRKADSNGPKFASKFNLGNSIYQQGRYEESVEFYDASTAKADDNINVSNAHYNKGNALFEQQQYYKAAEAYKEAIRTNSENKNAQYNLAMTKEVIKQIQQQQQEQEQQQENQEDSENQDQQNQEQQDGDSENQNQEQQEEQPEQQDSTIQNQSQFDSTRLEKQSLDSLDAAKLLQIIQSEEQKVQEKMRKFNSNRKKQDKDW